MSPADRPAIDAHAHIAPDVTRSQLDALGSSIVFAVTRSISEARKVARRSDPRLVWGLGIHPGVPEALDEYDEDIFKRAIPHFALIGEIGLDRRGNRQQQREVLDSILHLSQPEPVLLSIHSTGRTADIVDALATTPHIGAILHWFNGTPQQVDAAVDLGCYFSVNAAMDPATIASMPPERLLTETDFPSSRRRTQARKPGDVVAAEQLVANIHDVQPRALVADNLRRLLTVTGAIQRLPRTLRSHL